MFNRLFSAINKNFYAQKNRTGLDKPRFMPLDKRSTCVSCLFDIGVNDCIHSNDDDSISLYSTKNRGTMRSFLVSDHFLPSGQAYDNVDA